MLTPLSAGYASGYSGVTVSSGNSISADYFTVSVYYKTGTDYTVFTDFTPTGDIIDNDQTKRIRYKTVDGVNSIGGSYEITRDNIFLKIEGAPASARFTVSASGTATDATQNILDSSSVYLYEYGGLTPENTPIWNQPTEIVSGTYYLVRYYLNFDEGTVVHGTPVNNTLTLSITSSITITKITQQNRGVNAPSVESITIGFTAHNDSQTIIENNDSENLNGYSLVDSTDDTDYNAPGGGKCQTVNIDNPNSEGITNGGGRKRYCQYACRHQVHNRNRSEEGRKAWKRHRCHNQAGGYGGCEFLERTSQGSAA